MKKILSVVFLFCSATVFANQDESLFWFDPGLVIGNPSLGGTVSLNYQHDQLIYTADYLKQTNVFCTKDECFRFDATSVMLGKPVIFFGVDFDISAGVSDIKIEYDDYNYKVSSTGLALQLKKRVSVKYIGLGFLARATFSSKENAYAIGVTVPLGKLK